MKNSTTEPAHGRIGSTPPVTVRYWAAARAAAGCAEEQAAGSTVEEVLAAVVEAHSDTPRFAEVLGVSSVLIGEQPLGARDPAEVRISAGDVLEVLPPFAGG